ncbi:hypothetical protein [Streptomyces yunnanensis]|uniref:Uncharacterized protein n=1 Tax=Streptomyces yunnanensis TaxID=156453 RepID=A0A9X8N611_9ACTN|nr:hypothetical protein [Streptomyces yunnanensis]SHN12376.1 hypothetical protein SAMN05216268_12072 [Streptomyces yunnanensis]
MSKIARDEGPQFEGGARGAPATAARQLNLAEQRRQFVGRLYARGSAHLDRIEAPEYVRAELLPNGRAVRMISDEPPAQDERHHPQAISSYLTSAARLAEIDAGTSTGEIRGMLTDLAKGLQAALVDADQADEEAGRATPAVPANT